MPKDENRILESGAEQRDEMSEEEIDRNLMETFPASDPPSWTLGTNHREETRTEDETPADGAQTE